jgi:hypothetical protein
MLVLSVRISLPAWRPVGELFWWQALLLEKLLSSVHPMFARMILLVVYLAAGLAGWKILERSVQARHRAWTLAFIWSVAVQAALLGLGMWLAPE